MGDRQIRIEEEANAFAQFLAGDNGAFDLLFQRHNQRLFAYCLKVVRERTVAEDLVQEVWIRMIRLRAKPSQEVRNPLGLLIRTTRNLCLDHLRSRKESQPIVELDENEHPAYSLPELSMEEEIALRCLDLLPFDYRETLILNLYCGYTLEEIAAMLEKSADAIWARASRGRKKLRDLVTKQLRREQECLKLITRHTEMERRA